MTPAPPAVPGPAVLGPAAWEPAAWGAAVLGAGALAWTLWCAGSAVAGRAPGYPHRLALVILEAAVLVVALAATVGVLVAGGRPGAAVAEIVGYLIAAVITLPVGAALAHGEPTRYGSVVLAVTGFTLAVLVLRTYQVWESTRA